MSEEEPLPLPERAGWFWARIKNGKHGNPLLLIERDGKVMTQSGVTVDKLDYEWSDVPMEEPK